MAEKLPDLREMLKEVGLDEEIWWPELETMGIKSSKALCHLKGDTGALSTLQEATRFSWEKKALKELMKIDKVKFEMRRQGPNMQLEQEVKGEISGAGLLQVASDGRALQGVLLTRSLEDQQKRRSGLLKVPENVSIAGTFCLKEDIISFSSEHQESSYRATSDVLGHSIAVSAQTPVYGTLAIGVGVSGSNRSDEGTAKATEQTKYISTVKNCTMHVASYTFDNSDLKLSDDAKEDLKKIINTIEASDKPNTQGLCESFFSTYGSHVNQGPLQFGGNIWCTCSSKFVDTKELETVRQLQSEVIAASASGSLFSGASFDNIKSSYAGKCSESTLASTQLILHMNGGPTEATDLSVWKDGLVANNNTWILTDRGNKLVAVWDVIGRNHQEEFGEVKEVLIKVWEKMTGLQSEPYFMPNLKYDSEDVLRIVSEWNGKVLTPLELEDNLKYLLEVKEDLRIKATNPQCWANEYLSQEVLQTFLSLVVDSEGSSLTVSMKSLVQQIIEESDMKMLSTCNFPDIGRVSKWMCKKKVGQPLYLSTNCTNFESFLSYLQKTIKFVLNAKEPLHSLSIPVATNVSQTICSLRSNYQGTYDNILIEILVFPFQNDESGDVITLSPLCIQEELESMLEEFTMVIEKYVALTAARVSALQKQSFLFLLAVISCNKRESQLKPHLEKVGQMMKDLEPPLDTELMSYLSGLHPLPKFIRRLNSLLPTAYRSISLLDIILRTAKADVNADNSILPVIERNPEAHSLLLKLGLMEYYHRKLGLQDALCIRREPLEMSNPKKQMPNPKEPKQLPFLILQKLMSFDGRCRFDLMKDSRPKGKSDNTNINPADILLALIICSDHFLRQDLFARLAKCQYAVPFILPDPFTEELLIPLWAMRSITKEWKCVQTDQGKEEVVEHTSPIINYPMPIVSFLRLGKCQNRGKSKSKILNQVISDSKHFFHRGLPGGSFKKVLGDGLVDMTWYLPSGIKDDVFPDAVTFLNLHGDARSHPIQSRFLSQISSMCFIFVEKDLELNEDALKTLKHFSSSAGGITLLIKGDEAPEALMKESLSVTSIDMGVAEITHEIQHQMCHKLFAEKQRITTTTIEECCMEPGKDIHVDEFAEFFIKGQKQANQVISLIRNGKSIKLNAKEKMLPLQGEELWRKWSDLNKEWHQLEHLGIQCVQDYTQKIELQKASIRILQCKFVEALTPVMEVFITSLLVLEEKTTKNCFLQYLVLNLNLLSEECILKLLTLYQATRGEISKLELSTETKVKAGKENAAKLEEYRGKLKKIRNDIAKASFGLHHLLRELGQVYEAACEESSKYGDQLSRLPKVAADLLLDGYPLELMDGDAAHVPVKWVQAVISELNKKLNDPHMFVLSVLGLQSTGKSTMLNTVFGLTFKTSAGRCTHGAFMQLLPVDKTIEETTGYSYVLVIDTEGLRAPELDSSQARMHDNQLATFTIGLANLTFINISGEVIGDLDDILQTTVHAFLRMTEVKQHPSCQFIFQNARGSIKSQIGDDSFAQRLDKWTLAAAKEENYIFGQYERFSDVIQFDFNEDIHRFPGLWMGDPPMAPVNIDYSETAQEMKFRLFEKMCTEAKSTNISSFKTKLEDLWQALLRENFVFCFKNTEEIVAYNLLGTNFNKWEGEIQTEVLDWEKKATNEINTEKDIERISAVVKNKQKEAPSLVQQIYEVQREEMREFFADDKLKHTLVQWKAKFELKLEDVKKEWEAHADNHCIQLGRGRRAISKFEQDLNQQINAKAQEVIANMKAEQDELDKSLEKKSLDKLQLEKIMKHKKKLFTPEKLYKCGIKKTQQQCDDLTEEQVEGLLVGGALSPKVAMDVLKQGKLSEEELKAEFDEEWIKLVEDLRPVYNEPISVKAQVERKLIGFTATFGDTIKDALKIKPLREYGRKFVVDKKQYSLQKSNPKFGRLVGIFQRRPKLPEVTTVRNEILKEASDYLENTKRLQTYFNDAYVLELLQKVKQIVDEHSDDFTREGRIDIYLTVCGYALVQFEKMDESFRELNEPKKYLEKYQKEPFFARFKNQYYQTANEEAFADNLCAALIAPIAEQVEGSLCNKLVGRMKCEAYLSNKMALKAKILLDLGTEMDFKKFMTYLTDIKQCLRDWINHYTVEYCNKTVSSEDTQLQVLAKREVSRIVSLLKPKVDTVQDTVASKWLATFCEDVEVRRELGRLRLDTNNLLPNMNMLTLDLKNFQEKMRNELSKLERKLHSNFGMVICNEEEMEKWQEEPYNLLKSICGCTEQCPFCGEQCDLGEHSDTEVKHTVAQHRPACCNGCYYKTQTLALEICPANVAGERKFMNEDRKCEIPYKRYSEIYHDWHIPPDPSAKDSLYWMWFVGQHKDSLASHFKKAAPEIPVKWTKIEWQEVEAKLKGLYNL